MRYITIIMAFFLILLTACTPTIQLPDESSEQVYGIEYCDAKVKSAEVEFRYAYRELERTQERLQVIDDRIAVAKDSEDQETLEESKIDKNNAEQALRETKELLEDNQDYYLDITEKCAELAEKKQKDICEEFLDNIQQEILMAVKELKKHKENLEKTEVLLKEEISESASYETILSLEKDTEEENLKILTAQNYIDNLSDMRRELNELCA